MQDNALVERVCELGEAGISVVEIDKTLHREQVTEPDEAAPRVYRTAFPLRALRPPPPLPSTALPPETPPTHRTPHPTHPTPHTPHPTPHTPHPAPCSLAALLPAARSPQRLSA